MHAGHMDPNITIALGSDAMIGRRDLLTGGAVSAVLAGAGFAPNVAKADNVTLPFGAGDRPLVKVPGKRPLIGLTARPPQLETPFSVFNENVITPNDAFFVRYHLADIPLSIDPDTYRIDVKGFVDKPLSISLADLKAMPGTEIVAVNQCSGNSRGFFEPRVAGGQLANGAMGNGRWRGVALKSVLDKAGVKAGAKQVTFNGLDGPASPETPDFVKALDIDHARDGDVMIAWSLNGEDLPWLNGFPVRLIVPGYFGTYWVKHLSEITVVDKEFEGFWMKGAYRIPANDCACTEPGKAPTATVPINRLTIRSFMTSLADNAAVKASAPVTLKGIAFDGGYGISKVEVSTDDGGTWKDATLGQDLGKCSFREWTMPATFAAGQHAVRVRATNVKGQTQPMTPLWNPAGYLRNVVETTHVRAA